MVQIPNQSYKVIIMMETHIEGKDIFWPNIGRFTNSFILQSIASKKVNFEEDI